jgi:hypothetical protein
LFLLKLNRVRSQQRKREAADVGVVVEEEQPSVAASLQVTPTINFPVFLKAEAL